MVEIIFEAHGTTFDNEAHLSSGHNDVELSPLGVRQSREMGERYKDDHFDAIFCSDLQRAYKSAEIGFGNKWPIIQDARLRECNYGDFTQNPSEVVDKQKPLRIHEPFPNGESYEQTTARMKSFLEDLLRNYDNKRVMIIGHRATQYALDYLINGVPLEQLVSSHFKWQPGWIYKIWRSSLENDGDDFLKRLKGKFVSLYNKWKPTLSQRVNPKEANIISAYCTFLSYAVLVLSIALFITTYDVDNTSDDYFRSVVTTSLFDEKNDLAITYGRLVGFVPGDIRQQLAQNYLALKNPEFFGTPMAETQRKQIEQATSSGVLESLIDMNVVRQQHDKTAVLEHKLRKLKDLQFWLSVLSMGAILANTFYTSKLARNLLSK